MQPIQNNPVPPRGAPAAYFPVAIYARVSTLHQVGGRFDSCETQVAICRDYIRKHAQEGWVEYACHVDAAYSGGSMNRPGMQALKRQIEAGEVKVVLIFKFERMLRNTDDWGPFRALLAAHGCRLVSTTEDLSEETPSGRLKNNLLVSVAEYERLNTAAKVRSKLAELAKRGIWNCGLVPFGYDYESQAKMLHPHSTEAAIVRRIYDDAARLVSLTTIANTLNAEGVRTRQRIFKRRGGVKVTVGGSAIKSDWLRALIKNPLFAGRVRLKGNEYPGLHEALVTADLWEKANAAVATALRPARCEVQARDKHCHILKGLIRCGHCGRAMVPNAGGKRDPRGQLYRYYTCGRAHQEGAECPVRHVSANLLEKAVVGFIGKLAHHPDIVAAALGAIRSDVQAGREPAQRRLAEIDATLADIESKMQRVLDLALAGAEEDAMSEALRGRAAALKDEKQALLVEREQTRQAMLTAEKPRIDAERLTAALARFGDVMATLKPDEQKDLTRLAIARIELRNDTTGRRQMGWQRLRLALKLHSERLTKGMEQEIVVETRSEAKSPTVATVLFAPIVELQTMGRAPRATVVAPIHIEFTTSRSVPAPGPVEAPAGGSHPIHRAKAWARTLERSAGLSQAELARREHVTPVTLTYHLKLLQLAPEIQQVLLGVTTSADLRRYSLRRMKALAGLPVAAQRKQFEQLRATRRSDSVPPVKLAQNVASRARPSLDFDRTRTAESRETAGHGHRR